MFLLTNAWLESQSGRKVFKFRLELDESELNLEDVSDLTSEPTRVIPSEVKLEVWTPMAGNAYCVGQQTTCTMTTMSLFRKVGVR